MSFSRKVRQQISMALNRLGLTTPSQDNGLNAFTPTEAMPGIGATAKFNGGAHSGRQSDGKTFHYHRAIIGDCPLSETALQGTIDQITLINPKEGGRLAHDYKHKLQTSVAVFNALVEEAKRNLGERNEAIRRHNEESIARIDMIQLERDAEVQRLSGPLEGRRSELERARHDAADACSRAGGTFDPANPGEHNVLPTEPMTEEEAARCLGVPGASGIDTWMVSPAVWAVVTVIVGGFIGLGLGMATGLVDIDSLLRNGFALVPLTIGGAVIAYMSKLANRKAFHKVGRYRYAPNSQRDYAIAAVLAACVFLATLSADMTTECAGLLARFLFQDEAASLSGGPASPSTGNWIFFAVAGLFSIGYLVAAAYEGYNVGMLGELKQQIDGERMSVLRADIARRRDDPAVQTALGAIARVRNIEHRIAEQQELVKRAMAPFDADIQRLRAGMQSEDEGFSPEMEDKIRIAYEAAVGAQTDFDRELQAAMNYGRFGTSNISSRAGNS